MSELTEAILAGEVCQRCGEEIEPAAGYPTNCEACATEQRAERRKQEKGR